MNDSDARIAAALEATQVVREPRQHLATFGVTTLRYFMVTEPSYAELAPHQPEAVVREGTVVARQPEVVTPTYMLNLEGFGDEARRALRLVAERLGPHAPGLLYAYRNEPQRLDILGGRPREVAGRIKRDLDDRGEALAAVVLGLDELWDVCLLKFIFEFTAASIRGNVGELMGRRLLDPDPVCGVPRGAVERIEGLFERVRHGDADPADLKRELDRWGVFPQYEDRFLGLFRRRG